MPGQDKNMLDKNIDKNKLTELEKRISYKKNQRTLWRFLLIVCLAALLTGIFLWAQVDYLADIYTYKGFYGSDIKNYPIRLAKSANNVRMFGSSLILFSTVGFSYLYMVGFSIRSKNQNSSVTSTQDENEKLNEQLEILSLLGSINSNIEKGKLETVLSSAERSEIISSISATVDSQLNESLLLKIEEKYGSKVHSDKLGIKADELLTITVKRLKLNVEALQSKATINLVYGLLATISAILILIFVVIQATPPTTSNLVPTIFYYTSRLFLVLIIEGIAIFFLKLYKSTSSDILYVNNEITNYEAKRDSLSLAFMTGNTETTNEMLSILAKTERNFTIKNDEKSIFEADVLKDKEVIKELLEKLKI